MAGGQGLTHVPGVMPFSGGQACASSLGQAGSWHMGPPPPHRKNGPHRRSLGAHREDGQPDIDWLRSAGSADKEVVRKKNRRP